MDQIPGPAIQAHDPETEHLLPEVVLGPGAGRIHFDLRLPSNFRINPTAPFEMVADGDGHVLSVAGGPYRLHTGDPTFPVAVPVEAHPGQGWLRFQLMVYYCQMPGEKLCYYQSLRLRASVRVTEVGPPEAAVSFQMELPASPL
jgi:hypothetical protein